MALKDVRVLVVDDERRLVDILSIYLQDEGIAVTGVFDGPAALQAAAAQRYDLILLDLHLPALCGLEVLRALRRSSDVPILIMTARGETIPDADLALAADDFIFKPFRPREVVERIKALLEREASS
ncbi:MAG TPA: response regulator [Candidatus Acidoferrales bacterium]|nr:response regulator [Candidatus Acidoferrales bacterium]